MKDFIKQHKNELKFVYNFDSKANKFSVPLSVEMSDEKSNLKMKTIFSELIEDSSFSDDFKIGSNGGNKENSEVFSNWIIQETGIPATEYSLTQ